MALSEHLSPTHTQTNKKPVNITQSRTVVSPLRCRGGCKRRLSSSHRPTDVFVVHKSSQWWRLSDIYGLRQTALQGWKITQASSASCPPQKTSMMAYWYQLNEVTNIELRVLNHLTTLDLRLLYLPNLFLPPLAYEGVAMFTIVSVASTTDGINITTIFIAVYPFCSLSNHHHRLLLKKLKETGNGT